MRAYLRIALCICLFVMCAVNAYGEEYEKFEIKQGMHESTVNNKYGTPIATEKLKTGFLPISKKKALYKIDDSTHMILYFFSGRISEITILDDTENNEAVEFFQENNKR